VGVKIVGVDLTDDNLVTVWERPTPDPVRKRGKSREPVGELIERSKVPKPDNYELTKRDQSNGCNTPDQFQAWLRGVPW
jgi:hypothetical protein